MLDNLSKYKILLASKSPRRRELLTDLRIKFDTVTIGNVEESYPATLPTDRVAEYLSRLKAEAFLPMLHTNELLITADTIVICDNKISGKPANEEDAHRMLRRLSGKIHYVDTGVSITTSERMKSFTVRTEVKFADLSDEEIDYYISRFQPFDKAGAYGIQEWIGCAAVEWINGSFFNVMGLPTRRLYEELKQF